MQIEPCTRDDTNDWIYSETCKAYICRECVKDGMYTMDIEKECGVEVKHPTVYTLETGICLYVQEGDNRRSGATRFSTIHLEDYNYPHPSKFVTNNSGFLNVPGIGNFKVSTTTQVEEIS